MSFVDAIKTCFGKYATFSGRSARSEFWYFALFYFIVSVLLSVADTIVFGAREVAMMAASSGFDTGMSFSMGWQPQPLSGIFMLIMLLPSISVAVRRLHDTNRSGWWCWIALIPFIGPIVLLVFFVSKGTAGDNNYGSDPLA